MAYRLNLFVIGITGLLLVGCAEPHYLPTVNRPIALERHRQWEIGSSFGLLGALPVNGAELQVAYSPYPHWGIGLSSTYYHPIDDSRHKIAGDLIIGGYGRLSDDVQWNLYGLAGRMYSRFYPERWRNIINSGPQNGSPLTGGDEGMIELTLNRYAIWPSLRITDAFGMTFQLGGRLGVLGIEKMHLTPPLRNEDVRRHRAFAEATPFWYLDLLLTFELDVRGPHRLETTLVANAPPGGFPTPSLSVLLNYTYRFGE